MLVDKDYAYVLHQQPYRDNSALVHLCTKQHGKVSFIVSGLKSKQSTKRALLQPCQRLCISYTLKPNLSRLTEIELSPSVTTPPIQYFMLYQYAHELLLSLLPSQLPVPTIFTHYERFLGLLGESRPHLALRVLELSLIQQFSDIPELTLTQDTHSALSPDGIYYFSPEYGIYDDIDHAPNHAHGKNLNGDNLLAFHHLCEHHHETLSETLAQGAQPVTRYLIQQLLGDKSLKTRTIYQDLQQYS